MISPLEIFANVMAGLVLLLSILLALSVFITIIRDTNEKQSECEAKGGAYVQSQCLAKILFDDAD